MSNKSFEENVHDILEKFFNLERSQRSLRVLVSMMFREFSRLEMIEVKNSIARQTDMRFSNLFWNEYHQYY